MRGTCITCAPVPSQEAAAEQANRAAALELEAASHRESHAAAAASLAEVRAALEATKAEQAGAGATLVEVQAALRAAQVRPPLPPLPSLALTVTSSCGFALPCEQETVIAQASELKVARAAAEQADAARSLSEAQVRRE